ncbi:hypothetical protein KO527_05270 [Pseudoalteromonas sp. C2R02]|uniref:hypothetical protein n=1 Tax=Pseudoalteromonas sp. C2R02 TaxID=2841565 RepID=UPI001C09A2D6|nr:hypothetical protein [Pseudoalteromonas sp. C2R02]MBU2968758.1 hypothetical protein [Pseudoalteromonas sp. C2R02]
MNKGAIKLTDLINNEFNGDRVAAAKSVGVSRQFLKNWINQDREVLKLESGDYILTSKTTKIFSVN